MIKTDLIVASTILILMFSGCNTIKPNFDETPTAPIPLDYSIGSTTPQSIPTNMHTYTGIDIQFIFQTDFTQRTDLNYYSFSHSRRLYGVDDIVLEDGIAWLKKDSPDNMTAISPIQPGMGIHIRWKFIGNQNDCHGLQFWPNWGKTEEDTTVCGIELGACMNENINIEDLSNSFCQSKQRPLTIDGSIKMENDKWIDAVIFFEEKESLVAKILAWETRNPENYLIIVKPLSDWVDGDLITFTVGNFQKGEIAIDKIDLISHGVESYLWFNSPPFQNNYERINSFFETHDSGSSSSNPSISTELSGEIDSFANQNLVNGIIPQKDYDLFEDLFSKMITYNDLPLKYRIYQRQKSVSDSSDEIRLNETFVQGANSTNGGGLWIEHSLIIRDSPFSSLDELKQRYRFNSLREQFHKNYPEVGELNMVFFREPFEFFIFTKGNILVEIKCNSVFTGYHPYCDPESIGTLAQTIFDRLPDSINKPQGLDIVIPNNIDPHISNQYFDMLWLGDKKLYWKAHDWLPSMQLIIKDNYLQKYVFYSELVNLQNSRLGEGEEGFGLGLSDLSTSYSLYLLMDGNVVNQFDFVPMDYVE